MRVRIMWLPLSMGLVGGSLFAVALRPAWRLSLGDGCRRGAGPSGIPGDGPPGVGPIF
jgi:hypothetical protein